MNILASGAFWFGVVIGYITYRTLQRTSKSAISDIATVIGAVGGAAVVALFPVQGGRFDFYAVGLAGGFFFYLGLSLAIRVVNKDDAKTDSAKKFLGDDRA